MTAPNDPRRVVGATVYTRAKLVMNATECRRIFAAHYKTKEVSGVVVSVQTFHRNSQKSTFIEADWSVADTVKRRVVSLASVKACESQTGPAHTLEQPRNLRFQPLRHGPSRTMQLSLSRRVREIMMRTLVHRSQSCVRMAVTGTDRKSHCL